MRVPEVLLALTDQGVIDEVVRPLKSGKEAQVYLVRAGGEVRVAKVYKDAAHRSFKQRAQYTEGRRVRNTRDQRAIDRHTRHGKAQEEALWKSAEVDVIHRLHAGGVRVPTPFYFIDGVLIMELVRDEDGHPAPRLAELELDPERARDYYQRLLREVIKMLAAGVVHGDLSDYNVLVDPEGPVVIDFPQAVDAAQNRNARKLLIRDVDNLGEFLARCAPGTRRRPYGQEIWAAYEENRLTPDLELTGQVRSVAKVTDMRSLLGEIEDAERDERRRRDASGAPVVRPRKREVIMNAPRPEGDAGRRRGTGGRGAAAAQDRPAQRSRSGGGAGGRGAGPGGGGDERRRDGGRHGGSSDQRPRTAGGRSGHAHGERPRTDAGRSGERSHARGERSPRTDVGRSDPNGRGDRNESGRGERQSRGGPRHASPGHAGPSHGAASRGGPETSGHGGRNGARVDGAARRDAAPNDGEPIKKRRRRRRRRRAPDGAVPGSPTTDRNEGGASTPSTAPRPGPRNRSR